MLSTKGKSFKVPVAISGSGNVAQFACEKILDLGGKPVTSQIVAATYMMIWNR